MIDPLAQVDPRAKLAPEVHVGPWTYIGADVEIGSGTHIAPSVVIKGPTTIGKNNRIFQFATIGDEPADINYKGEPTVLAIGDNNTFREGVTLHRGTPAGRGETVIGNHNLLMAYSHVAHDCILGDHNILTNNTALAGFVRVGDWVTLGGYTLVQQRCSLGTGCFSSMGTAVSKDVPAYGRILGNPAHLRGINLVGMRRRQISEDAIRAVKAAFEIIYHGDTDLTHAYREIEILAAQANQEVLQPLLDSMTSLEYGLVHYKKTARL